MQHPQDEECTAHCCGVLQPAETPTSSSLGWSAAHPPGSSCCQETYAALISDCSNMLPEAEQPRWLWSSCIFAEPSAGGEEGLTLYCSKHSTNSVTCAEAAAAATGSLSCAPSTVQTAYVSRNLQDRSGSLQDVLSVSKSDIHCRRTRMSPGASPGKSGYADPNQDDCCHTHHLVDAEAVSRQAGAGLHDMIWQPVTEQESVGSDNLAYTSLLIVLSSLGMYSNRTE
jgi:hypothetical protein